MEYKLTFALSILLTIGCYKQEPQLFYTPVIEPVYDTSGHYEEDEEYHCDCDNYDEYECFDFDYEYECETEEPEFESDKYLYNTSTGKEIWVNEIGSGEYIDYESGQIYLPLDDSGFMYIGTDGEVYLSY